MVHSVFLFEPNPEDGSCDVPDWWWNFGEQFPDDVDKINELLLEHSAQFVCMKKRGPLGGFGKRYIDFYDEKAYTWFLLRWS